MIMAKKTQSQLTLAHILEDDRKYGNTKRVSLNSNYYTEIDEHFRPTKIENLFLDFSNFVKDFTEKVGEFNHNKLLDYLNLHILLHFSTLTDADGFQGTFEEKIMAFDKILDNEMAEKVFDAFDKKELQRVYERMWKKIETYLTMINADKKMKKEVQNYIAKSNLENKDDIVQAMFGGRQ